MKQRLVQLIFIIICLSGCKHDPLKIEAREVDEIELIEVAHHYLNESIDVWKIDHKQIPNLLHDLENAKPVFIFAFFYVCIIVMMSSIK